MRKTILLCCQLMAGILFSFSVKAQCYADFYVYQSYPYGQLCSPQYVTLRAEHNNYYGNYIYGQFRWYTSHTDPTPVYTEEVYSDYGDLASDYSFYASNGTTIWVSFYDYNTDCESERTPYGFYFGSSPTLNINYAIQCRYDPAKVQVSSNTSGVTFQLYKYHEYYDYNYGWVQEYQLQESNTTGYFEIWDFMPSDMYNYYVKLYQPYGCSTPYYYQLYFEVTGAQAPSISGNLSVAAGSGTTLYANGSASYYNWYDASNNLVHQGWSYSTSTSLQPGSYTYRVEGTNSTGNCISDPAYVTVSVNLPDVTYTSLFTNSSFTKTIDLSKPVGAINGTASVTPAGASTYTIPIYTPPGTNSFQPSVNIAYNSQGGNSVLGYGWNITGLSVISRMGKNLYHNGLTTPVTYTNQDGFALDGSMLVAIAGTNGANGTEYATEVESFAKIVSFGASSNNPDWFQVTSREGIVMEFGRTTDSRISTDDGVNVMLWRLSKIIDLNGNYMEFKYDNSFRDTRIAEINYTGNANMGLLPYNKIKFEYATRADRTTNYEAGGSLAFRHLLKSILVTSEGSAVKTYQLNYGMDNTTSLLKEITEHGSDGTSLNSTIFLYGEQPANMTTLSTVALTGSFDFFSGDFNADGKSDLLTAESYWDQNAGARLHTRYSLIDDVHESGYGLLYTKTLPQNTGSQIIQDKNFFNFLTADYNGDGRDDVMELTTKTENLFVCNGYRRRVLGSVINYTKGHNGQTGYTDYQQQSFGIPTDWLGYQYQYVSQKGHFFIPGDFDGDGNRDFILILSKLRQAGTCSFGFPKFEYDYKAFITSPSSNETNIEIRGFGFGPNPGADFYSASVANADLVNTLDFDGDGKTEVLVTKDYQSYVLSVQRLAPSTGWSFGGTISYTTSEVTKDSKVYPGDFNGDRKMDLLVRNSNGSWKILYSTGKTFISVPFSFNQAPNVTAASNNDKIVISDFNGDGFSDILHGYVVSGTSFSKFSMYYYRGMNSTTPFFYEQYSYNKPLSAYEITVGDFNGDGRSDLLNRYNIYAPADFISFKSSGQERLLQKVTNGHNSTVQFQYRNITDNSTWPFFHTRTVSLDDPSNKNPFNYVQYPIHVVSAVISPNGIGGTNTLTYRYENAVMHRWAKGFLGFLKVITTNNTTGTVAVVENAINTNYAIAHRTRMYTTLASTGEMLSEEIYTTSFISLSPGYRRTFQRLDKKLVKNFVTGGAIEESNTFDNYGNVIASVAKAGSFSGNTVNAVESVSTSATFSLHNTPVPSRPDQITVTRSRTGASPITSTMQYTYHGNGLLSGETEFAGLPKAVTTSYAYNGYGNTINTTRSASGVGSLVTVMTYDNKGRFALTKQAAAGTNIAQTETFTYDGKWGKALTSTSTDCITTSFQYDGYGRLKKKTDPVSTVNTSMVWDVQGNNIYYLLTDYPGGKPDTRLWIDILGRETKKQTAGFNNQWLNQVITYDAKGNTSTETTPHFSNETPLTTATTYDQYNRVKTVSNGLKTTTYQYFNTGGGNMQIVATDNAGQSETRVMDATGKRISSTDKGGDLFYSYDSRGLQTELRHGSTVLITTTYDPYGRQQTMVDKNAGTVTYDYDAFGLLRQQTDNVGNSYTMSYDVLGRVLTRQGPEGLTSFEYYRDNATGCSNNNISKLTGFNNVIRQYSFDAMKRLSQEQVTVDGVVYTTQYGYDAYGLLNKTTYPSGVEVNNVYDGNGELYIVTGGHPGQLRTLFYGSQKNGYGKFTAYTLGNSRTAQVTYQHGFPTRFYTQGIQDLNLTYDYAKGVLLSRFDAVKGQVEHFQYDALNRLTQSSVNGQVQLNLNYDGTATHSMGNIMSKTDAGNYVYKNDKVHAVAYITNPAGATAPPVTTSATEQVITYTSFLKAASITEQPYQVNFTYGPGYERVKTELKVNNVLAETKLYLGSFEKLITGSGTKEIHYVPGGNGLCAIIVRENGVNQFYTTYTDHLGSILAVTDVNATIVAEQNFDPWGRNRNPSTWMYTSVPSVPSWLYRGFTGHEHLPQFALINMNGRLYDPVMGRMISPDNLIAPPFGTQGYNRYTYALNNPLMFSDPDGQFIWFVVGAAVLFGAGNTIAHAIRGDIDNFWDGLRYFAQGAIVGAAIGTGVGLGLGVPILGTAIKVAGIAFISTTALSVVGGLAQGIFTGDWSGLRNSAQIFIGAFYLDENRSFFGGVWEGISRFTWELPQTTLGYSYTQVNNAFGGVDEVVFFGGATFAFNTFNDNQDGITIGNYINLRIRNGNTDILSDPLYMHEYGHYLQSHAFGVLYLFAIGVPSLFSAMNAEPLGGGLTTHDFRWYEMGANRYAARYFGRHFGVDWAPFEPAMGGTYPRRR